jgi:hypothetical protein
MADNKKNQPSSHFLLFSYASYASQVPGRLYSGSQRFFFTRFSRPWAGSISCCWLQLKHAYHTCSQRSKPSSSSHLCFSGHTLLVHGYNRALVVGTLHPFAVRATFVLLEFETDVQGRVSGHSPASRGRQLVPACLPGGDAPALFAVYTVIFYYRYYLTYI